MTLFRRLFHWGPLVAMLIIFCVTTATVMCLLEWWDPRQSLAAFANCLIFLFWVCCTMNNFICASEGPGYVRVGWKPPDPSCEESLQYCLVCKGFKAPRSHHCRKCNRCVLRMDHHCPWINNCCGHFNQLSFIKFLTFAIIGCLHGSFVLAPSIYRALFRVRYLMYGDGSEPIVNLGLYAVVYSLFALGLAVGVVVSLSVLLFFQLRIVLRNRTSIEDWIITKAMHRRRRHKSSTSDDNSSNDNDANSELEPGPFVYPYDLGWKRNFFEFFTRSGVPCSDGITWPVVDGCDQYTLTKEQLVQKEQKRSFSRVFFCVAPYSGNCLTVAFGVKAFCCIPLTDDPRLALSVGDRVRVTRWKRHWMYGELAPKFEVTETVVPGSRGWFPRNAVKEFVHND